MTSTAPRPASSAIEGPGPRSLFDGQRTAGEQLLVKAFVVVPLLALLAAVPLAWGWGLSWTDIGLAVSFYFLSGLGIKQYVLVEERQHRNQATATRILMSPCWRAPGAVRRPAAPGGVAYISTPNRLTLAPPGAERSGNPWHVREYVAAEYRELLEPHFSHVELLGLFHARRLRAHEIALRLGWDRVHPALRLSRPFYDRFVPAISERDFALREDGLDRALDFLAVCRP